MPMIRWRVVCAFDVAIERRSPSSAFMRVLFPTFGTPRIDTNPARCGVFVLSRSPSASGMLTIPLLLLLLLLLPSSLLSSCSAMGGSASNAIYMAEVGASAARNGVGRPWCNPPLRNVAARPSSKVGCMLDGPGRQSPCWRQDEVDA